MAKKKDDDAQETAVETGVMPAPAAAAGAAGAAGAGAATPTCKRCGKPITNKNGDNGCGAHTEGDKTVTNCVPKDAE